MAGLSTRAPIVKVYHDKSMILPDVSRVLACFYEKDIQFETHTASYKSLLRLQASTHAPVPFYDGRTFLEESREICRYIAETYEHHGYPFLLGKDALERASIEQWLHHEEHAFNPPSRSLFCHLAFPLDDEDKDEDIDLQKRMLEEVLDVYEQRLSDSEFLASNKFTLADLVHLPNSHYITASDKFVYLYDSRKNVQRWWNAISTRDSWKNVLRDIEKVEQLKKVEELEKQQQQQWQKEHPTNTNRQFRLDPHKHLSKKSQTILVSPPVPSISTSLTTPQSDTPGPPETFPGPPETSPDETPVPSSPITIPPVSPEKPPIPSQTSTPFTPVDSPITAEKPPRIDADKFSVRDASIPSKSTETDTPNKPRPSSSKEVSNNLHLFDFYKTRSRTDEAATYFESTSKRASEIPDKCSETDMPNDATSQSEPGPRSAKEDSDLPSASDFYKSDSTVTNVDSQDKQYTEGTPQRPPPPETIYGSATVQRATDTSGKLHSTEAHQTLKAEQWHATAAGLSGLKGDADHLVPTQQVKPCKGVQRYSSQDSEQASTSPLAQEPVSMDGQLVEGPEMKAQTPSIDQRRDVSSTLWRQAADARGSADVEGSSDDRDSILPPHTQKHAEEAKLVSADRIEATSLPKRITDEDAQAIPFQTTRDDAHDATQEAREIASAPRRRRAQDAQDTSEGIGTYNSVSSRPQHMDAARDASPPPKQETSEGPRRATTSFPLEYSGAHKAQRSIEEEEIVESSSSKARLLDSQVTSGERKTADSISGKQSLDHLQASSSSRQAAAGYARGPTGDVKELFTGETKQSQDVKDTSKRFRGTFEETKGPGSTLPRAEYSGAQNAEPTNEASTTPTSDQRKVVSTQLQSDVQDKQLKSPSAHEKVLGSPPSQAEAGNVSRATMNEETFSTEPHRKMLQESQFTPPKAKPTDSRGPIKVEKTPFHQKDHLVTQYSSTSKSQQAPVVPSVPSTIDDESTVSSAPRGKVHDDHGTEEPYKKGTVDDRKEVPPPGGQEATSQVQRASELLQEAAPDGDISNESSTIEQWHRTSVKLQDVTPRSGDDMLDVSTVDQKPTPLSQRAIPSAQDANEMTKRSVEQRVEPPAPIGAQTSDVQCASPSFPGVAMAGRAGEPVQMQAPTLDARPSSAPTKRAVTDAPATSDQGFVNTSVDDRTATSHVSEAQDSDTWPDSTPNPVNVRLTSGDVFVRRSLRDQGAQLPESTQAQQPFQAPGDSASAQDVPSDALGKAEFAKPTVTDQEGIEPKGGPASHLDPQLAGTLRAEAVHAEQKLVPSDQESVRAAQSLSSVDSKKQDIIVSAADQSKASQTIFHQEAIPSAPIRRQVPTSDTLHFRRKINQGAVDNPPNDYSATALVPSQEQVSHAQQKIPGKKDMTLIRGTRDSSASEKQLASAKAHEIAPDDYGTDELTPPFVSSEKEGSHVVSSTEPLEGPSPDAHGAVVDKETAKPPSGKTEALEARRDLTPTHGYVRPTSGDDPAKLRDHGPQSPAAAQATYFEAPRDLASTQDIPADALGNFKKLGPHSTDQGTIVSTPVQASDLNSQPDPAPREVAPAGKEFTLSGQVSVQSAQQPSPAEPRKEETIIAAAEQKMTPPITIDQRDTHGMREALQHAPWGTQEVTPNIDLDMSVPSQERVSQARHTSEPREGLTPHAQGSFVHEKTAPPVSLTRFSDAELGSTPTRGDVHPTGGIERRVEPLSAIQAPPPSHDSVLTEDISPDTSSKAQSMRPSSPDVQLGRPGEVTLAEQNFAQSVQDSAQSTQLPFSAESRNEKIKDSAHSAQPLTAAARDQAKDSQLTTGKQDMLPEQGTSKSPPLDTHHPSGELQKVAHDDRGIEESISTQGQVSHAKRDSEPHEGPNRDVHSAITSEKTVRPPSSQAQSSDSKSGSAPNQSDEPSSFLPHKAGQQYEETQAHRPHMEDLHDFTSTKEVQPAVALGKTMPLKPPSIDQEAKASGVVSTLAPDNQHGSRPGEVVPAGKFFALKDQDSAHSARKSSLSEPTKEQTTIAAPDQTKASQTIYGQQDILSARTKIKDSSDAQYPSWKLHEVTPEDHHIDGSIPSQEQDPHVGHTSEHPEGSTPDLQATIVKEPIENTAGPTSVPTTQRGMAPDQDSDRDSEPPASAASRKEETNVAAAGQTKAEQTIFGHEVIMPAPHTSEVSGEDLQVSPGDHPSGPTTDARGTVVDKKTPPPLLTQPHNLETGPYSTPDHGDVHPISHDEPATGLIHGQETQPEAASQASLPLEALHDSISTRKVSADAFGKDEPLKATETHHASRTIQETVLDVDRLHESVPSQEQVSLGGHAFQPSEGTTMDAAHTIVDDKTATPPSSTAKSSDAGSDLTPIHRGHHPSSGYEPALRNVHDKMVQPPAKTQDVYADASGKAKPIDQEAMAPMVGIASAPNVAKAASVEQESTISEPLSEVETRKEESTVVKAEESIVSQPTIGQEDIRHVPDIPSLIPDNDPSKESIANQEQVFLDKRTSEPRDGSLRDVQGVFVNKKTISPSSQAQISDAKRDSPLTRVHASTSEDQPTTSFLSDQGVQVPATTKSPPGPPPTEALRYSESTQDLPKSFKPSSTDEGLMSPTTVPASALDTQLRTAPDEVDFTEQKLPSPAQDLARSVQPSLCAEPTKEDAVVTTSDQTNATRTSVDKQDITNATRTSVDKPDMMPASEKEETSFSESDTRHVSRTNQRVALDDDRLDKMVPGQGQVSLDGHASKSREGTATDGAGTIVDEKKITLPSSPAKSSDAGSELTPTRRDLHPLSGYGPSLRIIPDKVAQTPETSQDVSADASGKAKPTDQVAMTPMVGQASAPGSAETASAEQKDDISEPLSVSESKKEESRVAEAEQRIVSQPTIGQRDIQRAPSTSEHTPDGDGKEDSVISQEQAPLDKHASEPREGSSPDMHGASVDKRTPTASSSQAQNSDTKPDLPPTRVNADPSKEDQTSTRLLPDQGLQATATAKSPPPSEASHYSESTQDVAKSSSAGEEVMSPTRVPAPALGTQLRTAQDEVDFTKQKLSSPAQDLARSAQPSLSAGPMKEDAVVAASDQTNATRKSVDQQDDQHASRTNANQGAALDDDQQKAGQAVSQVTQDKEKQVEETESQDTGTDEPEETNLHENTDHNNNETSQREALDQSGNLASGLQFLSKNTETGSKSTKEASNSIQADRESERTFEETKQQIQAKGKTQGGETAPASNTEQPKERDLPAGSTRSINSQFQGETSDKSVEQSSSTIQNTNKNSNKLDGPTNDSKSGDREENPSP